MEIISTASQLKEKDKHIQKLLEFNETMIVNIQLATGQTIPEHHAAQQVVIVVQEGAVEFTAEGNKQIATPHVILHISPYENHQLKAIEPSRLILFKIAD